MLKLYNTLSRKKEIFKPLKNKRVNLFVCGPTVYDFSHIGHARTYIAFDAIVKYLRGLGYLVFYLQNITDIDDKIIGRAKEEKVFWKDLSQKFEKEYLKDMKDLGINSVSQYSRAADYIKEIISQVERLLEKGFAYQISDGIYYDIKKFKDYGKLSGRTALQAQDAVSRIDEAKEKRNKGDFCLWKFSKPDEPKWKSHFGDGRPGWHIEDTAITEKHFGPQYDIHGGANELIFPHHEAEVAQMEAISNKKPLVRHWLHSGVLTVGGVKMSKSLKNFISIRDFLTENSSLSKQRTVLCRQARVLRLFILKSHYRSPIDYNEEAIKQTQKEIERIDEFIEKAKSQNPKVKTTTQNQKLIRNLILRIKKDFERAMEDDFNTPKALAAVFDLINEGNKMIEENKLSQEGAKSIYNLVKEFDEIFLVFLTKEKLVIPFEIKELLKKREEARRKNDWTKADKIRLQIEGRGYKIEDAIGGPKVKEI